MSVVQNMQLAIAVIEKFGFVSLGTTYIDDKKAEILLYDSERTAFLKATQGNYEYEPIKDGVGNIVGRMVAKIDGVSLVIYDHADERGVA